MAQNPHDYEFVEWLTEYKQNSNVVRLIFKVDDADKYTSDLCATLMHSLHVYVNYT